MNDRVSSPPPPLKYANLIGNFKIEDTTIAKSAAGPGRGGGISEQTLLKIHFRCATFTPLIGTYTRI
jgi:hypothetical protein